MHFRLPKPLHGWREFAGEVGIIVVGVLIALGAEQLVEEWRWGHEVHEAKAALSQEMAGLYENSTEMAVAEPCIDQQLVNLEKALLAPGPYKPVPLYKDQLEFTYRAPARNWSDNVWRSIVSEGVASHLNRQLRLQLAGLYAQAATESDLRTQAATFLFKTRVLARPIEPDPSTRATMVAELEQARGIYAFMAVVSNQIMKEIDDIGLTTIDKNAIAKDLSTSGTLTFCRAHRLPLGRAEPQAPR